MQHRNRIVTCVMATAIVALIGCAEGMTTPGKSQFHKDYVVARNALEAEQFPKAIRAYRALLPKSGPLEPRIRLEYAHSLLRDDQFAEAAQEARSIAATQSGTARAAALSVQATAEHELALKVMDKNPGDPIARNYLKSASVALTEVLADPGALDPTGALATRKKSIDATLAGLG